MKMFSLVNDQGTAAYETSLCENCMSEKDNQLYAREMAGQSILDDVDPESDFVDCSGNEVILCIICGYEPPTSIGKPFVV